MTKRKKGGDLNDLAIKPPAVVRSKFLYFIVKCIKKCWMPFAIFLITMAILFSLFRALTPWAKQYKGEVEQHLSSLLGQPVIISSMETSWYWFEPVLKLNQVAVSDSQDHVLKLSKLLVGIDLLSSLWHWHIQPGILYIDDVHLTMRQVGKHWEIDGLQHAHQVTTLDSNAYIPILGWILGQKKIIIKNFSALVHLNDGSLLPISALNISATNHSGRYRLKGTAKLAQMTPTELFILADMKLNPDTLDKISGHAYLSAHHLLPTQWQNFFPKTPYHFDGGKGEIEVWLDLLKGHVTGLQTRFNFHRLAWTHQAKPEPQFMQFLRANLAWHATKEGWQLSADHINLRLEGVRWPENAFKLNYQTSTQTYRVFIKELLLQPLLATGIEWPERMQPLLAIHPSGHLQDTQVGVKDSEVNYVLTRFSDLSFEGQGPLPAVRNLSGAFHWQPTRGRLELDGQSTTIAPKGLAPITFDALNAAFEWNDLAQGLRISMGRLALSHPDFKINARGVLDDAFSPASRHLQLTAELTATHAKKWLAYIPSTLLKPKLDAWLKHNIKRIDHVDGQITINGALADFPFDKQPGEFSVATRFSGMDLYFHKKWPLMSDIDTYIRLNKRSLEFDVIHANLKDIPLDQANLRIDDLGMGMDTLLIHGKLDVPGSKMKAYIFESPLKDHLEKLEHLDVSGLLGLDLHLEVPLYPEKDDVLVLGALTFNDNKLIFHQRLADLPIRHMGGVLHFNEHGIMDSELRARLLGGPVAIQVKSITAPKAATEINIEGDTSIDVLHQQFDFPLFEVMQGHLNLLSRLTLTDDPADFDHLQMRIPLKGVAIDLPAPLGKAAEETTPLTIDVDFNAEKALRLRFNYDNRLNSDVWFTVSNGLLALDKGKIQVGKGPVVWKNLSGLQMMGSLAALNVQQWQDVFEKFPKTPSGPNLLENLQLIDMTLGELAIGGQNYSKVGIKANRTGKNTWSFAVDQRDIAGHLNYQLSTNTLSGHLKRLYLSNSLLSSQQILKATAPLKPRDIPNLEVSVDAVKLGKLDIGHVDLKSSSIDSTWHLENCNIKSLAYELTLKGDWKQQDEKNNTDMRAVLKINKLSDILQRLNLTPVIDAKKGDIQFDGGWPGDIRHFSLATLRGNMYMELQDGRITHLSKETEEKLGLGKLLSILSLQTIPRRLKLDFSDLSQEGYSFDKLKGNFTLKNGVMNTKDSYIDGPVAYASMKGNLDVVHHRYDIDLHISPHITASLPIVATIAGGPIAGLAAWAASKIINQGMQTVTGYTYQVSGPWLKPVVKQISIFKKTEHQ